MFRANFIRQGQNSDLMTGHIKDGLSAIYLQENFSGLDMVAKGYSPGFYAVNFNKGNAMLRNGKEAFDKSVTKQAKKQKGKYEQFICRGQNRSPDLPKSHRFAC